MATETQQTPAILSSRPEDPAAWTPGSNWTHTTVSVPTTPGPHELLIEMVATGICHTDFAITSPPKFTSPRIPGHEGAGYVRAIGSAVKKDLRAGDAVLLSFDHCGACETCEDGHPAYCARFMALNMLCTPDVFKSADGDGSIAGKCFGQSSFAALSLVNEACVLNARDLVRDREELKLFAPLGCGVQTGMGAVLNMAQAGPKDRVMVLGLGGVGLSAVAAASIADCAQIIAVDRVPARIELAKTMGATHGLDSSSVDPSTLEATFKDLTSGRGPTVVIDTSSYVPLISATLATLAPRGLLIPLGAGRGPEYQLPVELNKHITNGTRVMGCIEGDAVPGDFVPKLVEFYRAGKLPLEKLCRFYKAADFKTALHDMHTGETIKPVLTW